MQRHQVVGGHVVGVRGVNPVRQVPAVLLVPESQFVLGKLQARRKIIGVERQRLPLARRALGETILLGKLRADEMVHFGVGFPKLEGLLTGACFTGVVVEQMGDDGAIGPGFGMPWIDGERLAQGLSGGLVILSVDEMPGQQQIAGGVMRVEFESGFQRFDHLLAIARRKRARQAVVKIRILRKFLEPIREGFRRQLKVALVQRELAASQIRLAILRIPFPGAIEKELEGALGIDAHEQCRMTDRREIRGVLVGPKPVGGEVVDLSKHLCRFIELAVPPADLLSEQTKLHTPREGLEIGGDHRIGVGVTAELEKRSGQEHPPFIRGFVVTYRLVARLDAFNIAPLQKQRLRLVDVDRSARRGGKPENRQQRQPRNQRLQAKDHRDSHGRCIPHRRSRNKPFAGGPEGPGVIKSA